MQSIFRFTLNMHETQSQITLPVARGDTSRVWKISFSDGDNAFTIPEGVLARMSIKRPSGTFVVAFCAIEKDTTVVYRLEQSPGVSDESGPHTCDISLISSDGEVLSSPKFTMLVDERAISQDDENITEEDQTTIDAVVIAEAARVAAEESRINSEAERVNAEAERAAAEALREEATTEAIRNAKSAYAIAVENGYEGTEEEFGEGLALVASVVVYNGEAVDIE